jgi:hypothetical protein
MKAKFFLAATLVLALVVGSVSAVNASPIQPKSTTINKSMSHAPMHHRHHHRHHHHHMMKH